MKRADAKMARARANVTDFNERCCIGQAVEVTRDDGSKEVRSTRSEAWVLPCGVPVVMLTGISGGYALSRVKPL